MAPKTLTDKVIFAIRELKDFRGSSRQAIGERTLMPLFPMKQYHLLTPLRPLRPSLQAKYLKSEFDFQNPAQLKKVFKAGVIKGLLIQNGQSFKVKGEEVRAGMPTLCTYCAIPRSLQTTS
jgi:hypothetical protein